MSFLRTIIESLRWACGFWLLWSIPRCSSDPVVADVPCPLAATDSAGEGALVAVIPARDEEGNLPRLLSSLAPLTSRGEVVVVDDHSVDRTGAVAAAAGAVVVEPGPLPPGWTGKAWACAAGADEAIARGADTLLFLDADCALDDGGIERLRAEHQRRRGLVSVQPYHVTNRPYERLSLFFNVIAMMGVGCFTPLRRPPRGAFGPCLLTSVADYRKAGGHGGVRGEVLDDVALAGSYRNAGLPVTCLGGRGAVNFRMYPGGFRSLLEGWTKNFAQGAAATRLTTMILVVVWLSGCISAAAALIIGPVGVALAIYGAYVLQLWWMARRLGRFGAVAVMLFPLPLLCFIAVFLRSIYRTYVRNSVAWKGRSIPLGRR